ncbi:MAG: hypothetical protein D8M57_19265 [Candidatus Scalindua sp. AMX11]|nr:MAG: hypothetical protein DWQ00_14765 [Candidatus Scalindua sp.]NOG85239.1 hypothetical protein [Planctomycetota bacterium]RZV61711.1 MAG: hypothetical protein EX341_18780 [Candidatus Scalindua sp. SCAELEC01]TDE63252.1 MAG: hypothetical protein D8M57_19265 [Candidatus Scalindua sp. AMX11]
MKVKRNDIIKNLPKKGFRKEASGHHIYFYHEYEGRETGVYIYISHSSKSKDIAGDLLLCTRKQLRLETNRETVDLINCPMTGDQFNSILIQRNVISEGPT